MARTYNRDSRGRFASGGGGGGGRGPVKVGRSGPRGGKVGTRAEQRRNAKAQADRTAQFQSKAVVGRSARDAYKAAAGAARAAGRQGPRNGIRSTGGLPRPVPGNSIKRTTGQRRGPMAAKRNAIRTYQPVTPQGLMDKGIRGMERGARKVREQMPKVRDLKGRANALKTQLARQAARDIADRLKPGINGELAGISLRSQGGRLNRAGADVIRRRAARAAAAAARGSKQAARAAEMYDQQLAFTGAGKPSRKAKNNLRPGPRNTKGAPPKRRRKRKG